MVVATCLETKTSSDAFRTLLFKIDKDYTLSLEASVEHSHQGIGEIIPLSYFISNENQDRLYFVGLASEDDGVVLLYEYSKKNKLFMESLHSQTSHQEKNPNELQQIQDRFYYAGELGKVMKLEICF